MNFRDNQQLFGSDPTLSLVAVEFAEPNAVDLFFRQPDGSTTCLQETFSPYLWVHDGVGGEPLSGDLPLDTLLRFPDWSAHQDMRGELARAGALSFSINDPVQQYLTTSGRTLFKGMAFEDLRRLQIEFTTAVTSGFEFSSSDRDPITAIALSDSTGWEASFPVTADDTGSEKAALAWLTAQIQERNPDVLEGHNLFKVTLPYLSVRAKKLKVRLAWGRGGEPLRSRSSRLQIAEKTIQYPKFTARGRHLVDTWVLAQYYDVSSRELENFDLGTIAAHFGVTEADTSLPGRAREVRAIAALLSQSYFIQAQIFPYGYQDVIIRGNATKIDALFLREYLRQGHSLPDFPEVRPFEGGYTAIFRTGLISEVWHCDVTSLYPSVMLSFGYLPEVDRLGIFRGLLEELRTFRIDAKRSMSAATDPRERNQFDALQSTFKILINSFYGYLGFAQGHFADFDAAEKVTAEGRGILRQMVDWLGEEGAEVVEIDTDGIYFHPPAGADAASLESRLTADLPSGIEVELGRRFLTMFSYKAKNYALLAEDGTVTMKGAALKSRGMEPYLRDYLSQLVRLILEKRPSEAAALRDRFAARLQAREIPVSELAKTEALQDSLASYEKKISSSSRNRSAAFELALKSGRPYQAGDQVTYYVTGTKKKVVAYENARLLAEWDPENPDENTAYYIGKLDELARKFAEFTAPEEPRLL